MEGVMMRSTDQIAIAVRAEDGTIRVSSRGFPPLSRWKKTPFVRGVVNLLSMLKLGTSTLNDSLELLGIEAEEPNKFEKWISTKTGKSSNDIAMTISVVLAVIVSVGLFFLLPALLTSWLDRMIHSSVLVNLIEGSLRLLIFLSYIIGIGFIPDIRRFFAYHGAEHKVVNCYEAGKQLNVANARAMTTLNPRCGTSFLLIVMIISVLVFTLTGWSGVWWTRFFVRLALLPVVASLSYEVLMLLARWDNWATRILRWPGMQLQRLTTRQPDDSMLEVSLAAFISVLDEEERKICVPADYRLPGEEEMEEEDRFQETAAIPDAAFDGIPGAADDSAGAVQAEDIKP